MPVERLRAIMERLRHPEDGCPWDREQDFASVAPYTIEEAYEVADAIERGDLHDLRDELGDLLFQVVFHARMAEEQGAFDFGAVVESICDKLERRHPHVFGDVRYASAEEQTQSWEAFKAEERAARGQSSGQLGGVPVGLPALTRAQKLGKRASRVGFDWPDSDGPRAKIDEELAELDAARREGAPPEQVAAELGDLLFAVVNLARHLGVDPEQALRGTNARFERRFRQVEAGLEARGIAAGEAGLELMDDLWNAAKRSEPPG
jgi:ATP diphosphatase